VKRRSRKKDKRKKVEAPINQLRLTSPRRPYCALNLFKLSKTDKDFGNSLAIVSHGSGPEVCSQGHRGTRLTQSGTKTCKTVPACSPHCLAGQDDNPEAQAAGAQEKQGFPAVLVVKTLIIRASMPNGISRRLAQDPSRSNSPTSPVGSPSSPPTSPTMVVTPTSVPTSLVDRTGYSAVRCCIRLLDSAVATRLLEFCGL
jgi:hypothetical protein